MTEPQRSAAQPDTAAPASGAATATADRRVPMESVHNARDLGGLPVTGGSVRWGRVIRSSSLATLSQEDAALLVGIGVNEVIDLRTDAERTAAPNHTIPGVQQLGLDVFADSSLNIAAQLSGVLSDPARALAALSGGDAEALLIDSYRDIVQLPSARLAYRKFFETIAAAEPDRATLFHCTAGKDRTGWGAASLLLLLGADHNTVMEDYLQTNADSAAAMQPYLDMVTARGGSPDALRAVLGVDERYLETALGLVRDEFGSIEAYASRGLGVSADTLATVRERLIETRSANA